MRRLLCAALASLLVVTAAFAGDKEAPEGEIRVLVTDAKGAPVAGAAATVTVELDYGGFKKTLTAEPAKTPAPDKGGPGSHGGQTATADGYTVEVIVLPTKEARAKPTAGAYFKAMAPMVAYQDSMKDAPPAEKPGKCSGCGMSMQEHPASFTAVVTVKAGDKSIEAKGFSYPESVADAATRIAALLDEIDGLVAGAKLADVASRSDQLSAVARRLGADSEPLDAGSQSAAKKAGDEIAALASSLGKAAAAQKPEDAKKAAASIRTKLETLKKIGK